MKDISDNNCGFYKDLDTNFKLACELCDKNYSHTELKNMLKNGNIPEKQIAALYYDYVNNKDDAQVLINNLTGCDGKIREAVALKINNLINENENHKKIFAEISAETFANATVDINANICRLIVDSAAMLKNNENFAVKYANLIIQKTNEAITELDKFIFRDKKYVINKQLFKLYWCLEALSKFFNYVNEKTLADITEKCANREEYTIREKAAQIILESNKFPQLKEKLMKDENYYVRQVLHHPRFL